MRAKLTMGSTPHGQKNEWYDKNSPDWKFRREFPTSSPMKGVKANAWEAMLGTPLKRK